MFPKPGIQPQIDPTLDPANLAQTQGLFQQGSVPPFQGGQPRIFGSVDQAQTTGHQPLEDSIAQSLFSSRQLTPEGMKIEHSTPMPAAAVNTMAQAGLAQSVNAPNQSLVGQKAPGLPSPQEVAMRKLFQI